MRLVLAFLALPLLHVASFAAEVPATSRVETVTIFLSGAEVTRFAKVKLEKGEHTIVFGDLPATALPGSIRVEGKASGKLDIGSVDTARKLLQRSESEAADAERKSIDEQLEQLRDQRSLVEADAQAANTQKQLIKNLAKLPARSPAAGAASTTTDDWSKVLSLIAEASTEAGRLALDANKKLRDLDRKIADLDKRQAVLAPRTVEQTEVRVHVIAQNPLDADLTIRYQVPDARWAPIYDARLETGTKTLPPRVTLARRAAVTQRSGEAWDGVTLKLSTARPSDGAAAPPLDTQSVDYEPDEPRPVAAAAPAMTMRAKRVARDDSAADLARPQAQELATQSAEIGEAVAQLDSAPFEATFEVPGRNTIAGTGEPKRVLLITEDIEPVLFSRSVPKLEPTAYLYAKLKLSKGTPLLPGQVFLFRDGTFVGSADMPLLSPGEEHDLGFGIDDMVKVKHVVLEEKRGETGLISTSHVDSRNYRVSVKNLHERAIDVTVLDRVPVSQNDEIKVELTGKTAPSKQNVDDRRGVLGFDAHLEPDEEKVIEYGYRISWPASKSIVYGP